MPHSSQIPPELKPQAEDPATVENRQPTVMAFRVMVVFAVLFSATVLALMTMLFGSESTPASRWLDQNAAWVLTFEFAAIGICIVIGIIQQRRLTWERYEQQLADYNARQAKLEATVRDVNGEQPS